MDIDFGELDNDEGFKSKVIDLHRNLNDASKLLHDFFSVTKYDELSLEDKVRYDLLLAFAINTYYWIYLRIKGVDTNNHDIKQQINRIREYMTKSKKIYEKKTLMPKLNQEAAKRFVRSGLWTPNSLSEENSTNTVKDDKENSSKKRKRSEFD